MLVEHEWANKVLAVYPDREAAKAIMRGCPQKLRRYVSGLVRVQILAFAYRHRLAWYEGKLHERVAE